MDLGSTVLLACCIRIMALEREFSTFFSLLLPFLLTMYLY